MNYCCNCGKKLIARWLPSQARERQVCSACNTIHYDNPKILVVCVIIWRDRIVFCRRAHEPAKGYWNLPTGFVEAHETLEEAAARELLEEVGLRIASENFALYAVANLPHMNQIHVLFSAEVSHEPTLSPGMESLDARLVSEAELSSIEIAYVDVLGAHFSNLFRRLRARDFSVISMTLRPRDEAAALERDAGNPTCGH